jgi:hypothetical protein
MEKKLSNFDSKKRNNRDVLLRRIRCPGSSLASDSGESQLEAFCTSGDSPGKGSNDVGSLH